VRCSALLVMLLVISPATPVRGGDAKPYSAAERQHWSLRKRSRPVVPSEFTAADARWVRNPVDAFVLRKLRTASLRPAPAANRRTLIRRLTYDLTGLPPTPAQVAAFLNDRSPDAYERLVDRLLASPHYGEQWGQHWLDVVRFAETEGFEYDRYRPGAWRYRDYVIRAFDGDKPYDRFVMEQLAGDELNAATGPSATRDVVREREVATGFHRLGAVRRNAGNAKVAFSRNEVLTEMTDVIGTAFLGMTLGCARCHDHQYDPIRQKDYYRFQAFLAATREYDIPLADAATRKRWQARTDAIKKQMAAVAKQLQSADPATQSELRRRLSRLEVRLPPPLPVVFSVRNDPKRRTVIHLLERGEEDKKGERLGMRVLGVLLPDGAAALPADAERPKLRLARWITQPDHPLTARVMVNRIWQYHFGRGIVETPNDFGVNGGAPSHPELLDYLANRFVESGWSVKAIHRLILTSSTYRQSFRHSPHVKRPGRSERPGRSAERGAFADADNRLLWGFPRRRLTAEELRDSLLAVSGRLNCKRGGRSVTVPVDPQLVNLLYKPSQWSVTPNAAEHDRRSIYLLAKRNLQVPFLEVFDLPTLQTSCGRRASSTHAPQALELLNGRLSNELARSFAERLRREAGDEPSRRIELAFQLVAGRPPSRREMELSRRFLKAESLKEFALAMFNLNAFLYVE
jgi:Protein of unknown function (DUF1553)/Protein of unknown function (DUF1549)